LRAVTLWLVLSLAGIAHAQFTVSGFGAISGFGINGGVVGSGGGGGGYTEISGIDDITTQGSPGWSACVGSCAGGNNPTSNVQSFGVSTQSEDGASMSMAMVAGSGGANWAEVYKAVHNPDAYSEFKIDLYFYCDTNCGAYVKQYEFDDFQFCAGCTDGGVFPNGIEYMFGFQCDLTRSGGVAEVWSQGGHEKGGAGWITATYSGGNIPCTAAGFLSPNTWHHLQKTLHRVIGDYSSCTYSTYSFPSMYYDNITLDGTSYTPTNTNLCAGDLPSGWSSVIGTQMQIDADATTSGNTVTEYFDLVDYYYQ
jgi:hypothetical protein